jgi:hypothetical protein
LRLKEAGYDVKPRGNVAYLFCSLKKGLSEEEKPGPSREAESSQVPNFSSSDDSIV